MAQNVEIKDIPIRLITAGGPAYVKTDAITACRVERSYAVSFYQIDYQRLIERALGHPEEATASLVARVVMDEAAFRKLRSEVNELFIASGLTDTPDANQV